MTDSEWIGHPNELPPNFTRINKAEFWRLFSYGDYARSEGRYFCRESGKAAGVYGAHATLFVNDWNKTGFGFVKHIEHASYVEPEIFFTFAECQHDYIPAGSPGNCLHNYKCSKCGHSYTVDSSD